jgi:hypothetical protein
VFFFVTQVFFLFNFIHFYSEFIWDWILWFASASFAWDSHDVKKKSNTWLMLGLVKQDSISLI